MDWPNLIRASGIAAGTQTIQLSMFPFKFKSEILFPVGQCKACLYKAAKGFVLSRLGIVLIIISWRSVSSSLSLLSLLFFFHFNWRSHFEPASDGLMGLVVDIRFCFPTSCWFCSFDGKFPISFPLEASLVFTKILYLFSSVILEYFLLFIG